MRMLLLVSALLLVDTCRASYTFKEIKGRLQSNQNIDLSLLTITINIECWIPQWPDESDPCGTISQSVSVTTDGNLLVPELKNPYGNSWKNSYVFTGKIYSTEIGSVDLGRLSVSDALFKEMRRALKNGTIILFNNVQTQLKLFNGKDVDMWIADLAKAGKKLSLHSRFRKKGDGEYYQRGGPYHFDDIRSSTIVLQTFPAMKFLVDSSLEEVVKEYYVELELSLCNSSGCKDRIVKFARIPVREEGLEDYMSLTIPDFDK